jgi:hypothetical protein
MCLCMPFTCSSKIICPALGIEVNLVVNRAELRDIYTLFSEGVLTRLSAYVGRGWM